VRWEKAEPIPNNNLDHPNHRCHGSPQHTLDDFTPHINEPLYFHGDFHSGIRQFGSNRTEEIRIEYNSFLKSQSKDLLTEFNIVSDVFISTCMM
jgi:hypothetical protein